VQRTAGRASRSAMAWRASRDLATSCLACQARGESPDCRVMYRLVARPRVALALTCQQAAAGSGTYAADANMALD
jgi:hypothetical protein